MKKLSVRKSQRLSNSQRNFIMIACGIAVVAFFCGILFSKIPKPKLPKKIIPKEVITKPTLGVIALIIDDWGSGKSVIPFISTVNVPVAIAVLPKLPYSKTIAEYAHANNKEVMLHLPMEPHSTADIYPKDYIIKASMSPTKIKMLINEDLLTVPFAQGINNHMGSKATESEKLIAIIYSYLKTKDFFFVDSTTSEKSICENIAKDLNIPFTKRDMFIDNKADQVYIKNQIAELAQLAQKQGSAVGIGHARPLTLQVLKEEIPALKEKGFKFITVREMITYQKNNPR